MLANEQVIDGHCERCGTAVELRQLEQWFFRITDYADRLLDDLDTIDWPQHVVTMQRNWIGRSEGAEVTFSEPEIGRRLLRLHHPPGHAVRRDVLRDGARAPRRAAPGRRHRARAARSASTSISVLTESREERADTERTKTGVPLGRSVINPVNGERIPMYVADYVLMEYGTGAIMAVPGHDERDFDFATAVRPADPPRRRRRRGAALLRRRPAGQLLARVRRPQQPRRAGEDRRLAGPRGQGPPLDQLPPARLAAVAPALLGRADPDRLLRHARDRARARGRPAGRAARRRGLRAAGQVAAGRGRGLGQHDVPDLRRPRAPRDGHDGHVRRLVLVLPALHGREQRRRGLGPQDPRQLDAGRPVHRRRRARDPAPDVRALLREGAGRPRPAGGPGAVQGAVHAGHDHPRRGEDVQVQGQHDQPGAVRRALRRGHRALLHPLHRPARPGRRLERRGRRGRAPLPGPPVAPGRRRRRADAARSRCWARWSRRRATTWS